MLFSQRTISRGMVDNEVHHGPETDINAVVQGLPQKSHAIARSALRYEIGINPVVVFDRIKAAGIAGIVGGVYKQPVEAPVGSAISVRKALRHGPHKTGEEIINYRDFALRPHDKLASSQIIVCPAHRINSNEGWRKPESQQHRKTLKVV